MSPVPAGWERAHEDALIDTTIPLFTATDPQYAGMNHAYCRDKIDAGSMFLWRKTGVALGINWDLPNEATTLGIAFAFFRWRPRKGNGLPNEQRFCLCLFLGTTQTNANAILIDLETAVRAFADDQIARNRFYVVKEDGKTYPQRVEDVFNLESARLTSNADWKKEHGWPKRKVWKIDIWN
jgi:hypothetical protein